MLACPDMPIGEMAGISLDGPRCNAASGYRLNAAVLPDITQFTIALNFEFSGSTLSLVQPPFPRDPGPLEATGRRAYSPGARGESAPAAARYCYPSESSAGTRTR